jgi:hypothetical protein
MSNYAYAASRHLALGGYAQNSYTETVIDLTMGCRSDLLLDFPLDGDRAVVFTRQLLTNAGLQVARSFELDSACGSMTNNICPHSGEAPCNCQVSVLSVRDGITTPAYLVLHACKDTTEVFLEGGGSSALSEDLKNRIIEALNA